MLGTQGTTIHAVVCQELKKAAGALAHSAHMLRSPALSRRPEIILDSVEQINKEDTHTHTTHTHTTYSLTDAHIQIHFPLSHTPIH